MWTWELKMLSMVRGNKNCNFHGKGKQITPPSCTNCQNSRLSHLWLLHFWSLCNCHLVISGTVILFIPGPDVAHTITNTITWITREMPSIITTRDLIIFTGHVSKWRQQLMLVAWWLTAELQFNYPPPPLKTPDTWCQPVTPELTITRSWIMDICEHPLTISSGNHNPSPWHPLL